MDHVNAPTVTPILEIPNQPITRFVEELRQSEPSLTQDVVERLIRVAFAASLEANEQQQCTFRLGWVPRVDVAWLLQCEPVAFDVGAVRRFASASSLRSMIGVAHEQIVGIALRESGCSFFVDATAPGRLKLGGWSGAPSVIIEPDRTVFVGEVGGAPMTMLASLIEQEHPDLRRRIAFASSIAHLLEGLTRLRHGGTVIVLGRSWTEFEKHFSSWICAPCPVGPIGSLIDSLIDPPDWQRDSQIRQMHTEAARRNLESVEQSLAELAAMDGALVLDADLCVLGIGAKLSARGEPLVSCVWPSVPPTKEHLAVSDLGGTRHQSAARFVAQHGDALAFVVSTDGPITAFAPAASATEVSAIRRFDWLL